MQSDLRQHKTVTFILSASWLMKKFWSGKGFVALNCKIYQYKFNSFVLKHNPKLQERFWIDSLHLIFAMLKTIWQLLLWVESVKLTLQYSIHLQRKDTRNQRHISWGVPTTNLATDLYVNTHFSVWQWTQEPQGWGDTTLMQV